MTSYPVDDFALCGYVSSQHRAPLAHRFCALKTSRLFVVYLNRERLDGEYPVRDLMTELLIETISIGLLTCWILLIVVV